MIKAITRPAGITTQTGTVTVRGELITVMTYSGISLSLSALSEDGKSHADQAAFLPRKVILLLLNYTLSKSERSVNGFQFSASVTSFISNVFSSFVVSTV